LPGSGCEGGVQCQGGQNPPPGGLHGIDDPPVACPHGVSHVGGCMPGSEVTYGTVEVADGIVM
jgi:hypothetical protein